MISFTKNKKFLGKAAEHYLRYLCRLSNFPFLIPNSNSLFDLMVDFGEGLKKVQIKSSYSKNLRGDYTFSIVKVRINRTSSRRVRYNSKDVDYFFLMDIEGNCWLVPFEKLQNYKSKVIPEKACLEYKLDL